MIHVYNTIQFNLNTTTLHKIHNYTKYITTQIQQYKNV